MQEKNFEKDVRQKMEELSFNPSPPVWLKVEERIRKKKEKRRFLLWLLPLLLLTSGIIWRTVFVPNGSATNSADSSTAVPSAKKALTNQIKMVTPDTDKKVTQKTIKNKESITIKDPFTCITTNTTAPVPMIIKNNKEPEKRMETTSTALMNEPSKKRINDELSSAIAQDRKEQQITSTDTTKANTNTIQEDKKPSNQVPDSTKVKTINKPQDTAKKAEAVAVQKQQTQRSRKLKFGIEAQLGFSGISAGLLNGFGQQAALDYSAVTPVQPSSTNTAARLPPSKIRRGLSYSAGFSVKKTAKRNAISLGLHYQHYSTKMNVGNRRERDTTLSNFSRNAASYYSNSNQQTIYTNKYHFVKLPVVYEYQLFKRLPLQAGVGIALTQLISSNALHYNAGGNIYFRDNTLLRKTAVELSAGITYKLATSAKFSLVIGPQLQYGLTPVNKNNNTGSQHLYSLGIHTGIQF